MPKTFPEGVLRGPWDEATLLDFVARTAAPMRLAVNRPSGFPLLTPLWHIWADGEIWAAARSRSAVIRSLRRDGRCAFEISVETPPYMGVRGHGHALIESNGKEVLEILLSRFMGDAAPNFRKRLLNAAQQGESAIRIRPERLTSWDFAKRMAE